jgi:hypothetical protein
MKSESHELQFGVIFIFLHKIKESLYLMICLVLWEPPTFFLIPNLFAICKNTFSKWWEELRMSYRRVLSSTPVSKGFGNDVR